VKKHQSKLLATALVLAVVACALLAALAAPARATDRDDCYALLMGANEFPWGGHSYGPIPAENDIALWERLLVDRLGWDPANVSIQMNELFTHDNILDQIRALKAYDSPDSVFLIYMATHGWTIKDAGSLLEGDEEAYDSGRRQGHDPWDELLFTYDSDGKTLENVVVDDELRLLFDDLKLEGKVIFVSCTCCGGGLVEDITKDGTRKGMLALAVCNSDRNEMHWWEVHNLPAYPLGGMPDESWPWPWYLDTVAHPELLLPDANRDAKVSVEEAFSWAVVAQEAALPKAKAWGGGPCAQYMYDGIEGETFLPSYPALD